MERAAALQGGSSSMATKMTRAHGNLIGQGNGRSSLDMIGDDSTFRDDLLELRACHTHNPTERVV